MNFQYHTDAKRLIRDRGYLEPYEKQWLAEAGCTQTDILPFETVVSLYEDVLIFGPNSTRLLAFIDAFHKMLEDFPSVEAAQAWVMGMEEEPNSLNNIWDTISDLNFRVKYKLLDDDGFWAMNTELHALSNHFVDVLSLRGRNPRVVFAMLFVYACTDDFTAYPELKEDLEHARKLLDAEVMGA